MNSFRSIAITMKNTTDFKPNISIPSATDVIMQPVVPPNSVIAPIAAPIWGSIPMKLDSNIPNVAPHINAGPTFPPLKPIDKHSAVNNVFNMNVYHI